MKKQLLFTTSIFVSGLLCAQVSKQVNKFPANLANKTAIRTKINIDENTPSFSTQTAIKATKIVSSSVAKTNALSETVLGGTYYDLQSNSSVGDRIVVNQDGTIAAVWTMEPSDLTQSFVNRGTGYAYFNGSAWSSPPTARIENARVGWGNIVNTRSGKELVLSHNGGASKLHLTSRPVKGTGTWANSTTAVPSANTGGNFWPRMVNSGDTVYAISLTYPTTGTPPGQVYQGLDGAVVFHRSFDGGVTWNLNNTIPTGLDNTTKFRGFGGDAYAIAAKGSTVVVVAGDADKDVVMSKSTDAGLTWSSVVVMDCPIDKWDHTTTTSDYDNDGLIDTLETNDGTFAIGLDNNNEAYVFFGRMRIIQDAVATNQGYSYYPTTDGLYMWRESFGPSTYPNATLPIVAYIEDLGEQGTIYLPTPADPAKRPFGSFGGSLTSYPSVAFDANNIMYLSYSSIVDSLLGVADDEKVCRHVFIIKSCDGGANWSAPYDVVGSTQVATVDAQEGVFASMAKKVDGSVHLIYMRDYYQGYGVSQTTADIDNQGNLSDMVYVKVPTSDFQNCSVITGIKEVSSSVAVLNFYPNPASTNATIDVVLNETAKLDISILNAVGQTVYSTSVSGNVGSNKVELNLNNLSSGLYFYQVKVGNNKAITKKFAVGK